MEALVWRWVQTYGPELEKRCRHHLKPTAKSYRVDETYIRIKGQDKCLYRAVDKHGQTIDFLLTARHDACAAKRFFRKALNGRQNPHPRVINVDKNLGLPRRSRSTQRGRNIASSLPGGASANS
jgi:transposase, IS6 family